MKAFLNQRSPFTWMLSVTVAFLLGACGGETDPKVNPTRQSNKSQGIEKIAKELDIKLSSNLKSDAEAAQILLDYLKDVDPYEGSKTLLKQGELFLRLRTEIMKSTDPKLRTTTWLKNMDLYREKLLRLTLIEIERSDDEKDGYYQEATLKEYIEGTKDLVEDVQLADDYGWCTQLLSTLVPLAKLMTKFELDEAKQLQKAYADIARLYFINQIIRGEGGLMNQLFAFKQESKTYFPNTIAKVVEMIGSKKADFKKYKSLLLQRINKYQSYLVNSNDKQAMTKVVNAL